MIPSYISRYTDRFIDKVPHSKYTGIEYYSFLQIFRGKFIERIYASKLTKTYGLQIQEVAVFAENGDTYSKNCNYNPWSVCAFITIDFKKSTMVHDLHKGDVLFIIDKIRRKELFTLDDAVKLDPTIKYCGYVENPYIGFIKYISLYRKHPIGEMIMKLKLFRLCTEKALTYIEKNKAFQKYLFKNSETLKDRAFQHIRGAYKKNQDVDDYCTSLQYRIDLGKELSLSNKVAFKYATYEKIKEYLENNNINSQSYNDYLTAVEWLKLNLKDTKVLFPHNFQEVHDNYTAQYSEYKFAQNREREKILYADKSKEIAKVAKKYNYVEYKNKQYSIIIAKSKDDLINEGHELDHCVGRMNYDERQINEKSLICFLRKNKNIDKPFVTIELSLPTFRIKQCYGFKDSVVHDLEHLKYRWVSVIKKRHKQLLKGEKEYANI